MSTGMLRPVLVLLPLALATMACTLGAPPQATPIPIPSATPTIQIVLASPAPTSSPAPTNTTAVQPCTPNTAGVAYRIQAGESLSVLAARTNTTVDALVRANCLANPNQLSVGQVIYLPRIPATIPPTAVNAAMKSVQIVTSEGTTPLDRYVRPNTTVTLAVDITNISSVTFFVTEEGRGTTTLGTSANPVSPATLLWPVPGRPGLSLFFWAQGKTPDGQTLQTPLTRVTVLGGPATAVTQAPPPISHVTISPSEGQTSDTRLVKAGATVTIIVDNISSGSTVTFYAEDPGVSTNLLGTSANPVNVATLLWQVPNLPGKDLFVYVVITLPNGQKVQTGALTVRIQS